METQNNSVKIYKMIIQATKQNKKSLKYNIEELKDILNIKNSTRMWCHFNKKVLEKAKEDINTYSNILLDINKHKTKQKFTDIEFIFEYKNRDLKNQEKEIKSYLTSMEKKEKEIEKNKYKRLKNYEMTNTERNFFMNIVSKINNKEHEILAICIIPKQELKQIIEYSGEDLTHIKRLACEIADRASNKIFDVSYTKRSKIDKTIIDFNKEIMFFEFVGFDGEGMYMAYQLNKSTARYLLNLKTKYKKITIEDINRMFKKDY